MSEPTDAGLIAEMDRRWWPEGRGDVYRLPLESWSDHDLAYELAKRLKESREKLAKARRAVHELAHGRQSMRDYANKILSATWTDEKATETGGE